MIKHKQIVISLADSRDQSVLDYRSNQPTSVVTTAWHGRHLDGCYCVIIK